jgi:hypothetical protein
MNRLTSTFGSLPFPPLFSTRKNDHGQLTAISVEPSWAYTASSSR